MSTLSDRLGVDGCAHKVRPGLPVSSTPGRGGIPTHRGGCDPSCGSCAWLLRSPSTIKSESCDPPLRRLMRRRSHANHTRAIPIDERLTATCKCSDMAARPVSSSWPLSELHAHASNQLLHTQCCAALRAATCQGLATSHDVTCWLCMCRLETVLLLLLLHCQQVLLLRFVRCLEHSVGERPYSL